ncbi:MAG: hypothetical protein ACTSSP_07710 [Candidatus Asgardarchaeia archaeon]
MSLGKRFLDLMDYLFDTIKTISPSLWKSEADEVLHEYLFLSKASFSYLYQKNAILHFGKSADMLMSVKSSLIFNDYIFIQDHLLYPLISGIQSGKIKSIKDAKYYIHLYDEVINPIKEYIRRGFVYFVPSFDFALISGPRLSTEKFELLTRSLSSLPEYSLNSLLYSHTYGWPIFTDDPSFLKAFYKKTINEIIPFFTFINELGASAFVFQINLISEIENFREYKKDFEVILNPKSIVDTLESMSINKLLSYRSCLNLDEFRRIVQGYKPGLEEDLELALQEWLRLIISEYPDWRFDIMKLLSTIGFVITYKVSPMLSAAAPFLATIINIPDMAKIFLDTLISLQIQYTSRYRQKKISYVIAANPSFHELINFEPDYNFIAYFKEQYRQAPYFFEKLSRVLI